MGTTYDAGKTGETNCWDLKLAKICNSGAKENERTLREVGVKIRLRWDKNRLLVRQEKASL